MIAHSNQGTIVDKRVEQITDHRLWRGKDSRTRIESSSPFVTLHGSATLRLMVSVLGSGTLSPWTAAKRLC